MHLQIFILKKLTFFLLLLLVTACQRQPSIGYVNPNKLMQGYHGATAQHAVFKAKALGWQQRIDSLGRELQALGSAPPATRAAKEQQLGRYREAIEQQARQENERLTKAVLEEVNAYLKQYGKAKGYACLLGATDVSDKIA